MTTGMHTCMERSAAAKSNVPTPYLYKKTIWALPYINGCPSSLLQVRKLTRPGKGVVRREFNFFFIFIFFSAEKSLEEGGVHSVA